MINYEWFNKDLTKENLNKYKKEILSRIEEINNINCDNNVIRLVCNDKENKSSFSCNKFIIYNEEVVKYNLLCILTNDDSFIGVLKFKCSFVNCKNNEN